MAARPDMTAHWESVLTQISEKQCRYQDFMQPLVDTLYQLIEQAKRTPVKRFRGIVAPGGGEKKKSAPRKRAGKKARLLRRQAVRPNKRKAIWPDDGIK